jgi:hypothetical protein
MRRTRTYVLLRLLCSVPDIDAVPIVKYLRKTCRSRHTRTAERETGGNHRESQWGDNSVEVTSVSADSRELESPFHHFLCLDMVQIDWELSGCHLSDSAILLEIWERGAMLQTSISIPERSSITFRVNEMAIAAEVSASQRDQDFGFLIEVEIDAPGMWYPHGYIPAWQIPTDPQR